LSLKNGAFFDSRKTTNQLHLRLDKHTGLMMPILQIGTRSFHADAHRVTAEAELMFRMSPEQRRYRIEAAKTKLVRAVAETGDEASAAAREAVATLLSQGIFAI
jgi:hypothetical protein